MQLRRAAAGAVGVRLFYHIMDPLLTEDDMITFIQHMDNVALMRKAQAIVKQREAARIARSLGGQKVSRSRGGSVTLRPVANIHPSYYFARMFEEQKLNDGRFERQENIWQDPEFLPWEMKRNEALRPVIDKDESRVSMAGLVLPAKRNVRESVSYTKESK